MGRGPVATAFGMPRTVVARKPRAATWGGPYEICALSRRQGEGGRRIAGGSLPLQDYGSEFILFP
jgi:hypothetical protein